MPPEGNEGFIGAQAPNRFAARAPPAAIRAKTVPTERRIARLRFVVVVASATLYVGFFDKTGVNFALGLVTIGMGVAYALWFAVAQPYLNHPRAYSWYIIPLVDGALVTLAVAATGGVASPFHLFFYASVLAVSFRYPANVTHVFGAAYGVLYTGVLLVTGFTAADYGVVGVRLVFMGLFAVFGGILARESYALIGAKLRLVALARVANHVTGAVDNERGLRAVAEAAVDLLDARCSHVVMTDRLNRPMLLATAGPSPPAVDQIAADAIAALDADGPAVLPFKSGDMQGLRAYRMRVDGITRGALVTVAPPDQASTMEDDETGVLLAGYAAILLARTEAVGALEKAAADLRQSNDELSRFADVASHDLQEPLRSVAQHADDLEKAIEPGERHDIEEAFAGVRGGVRRMRVLIDDLLVYARAQSAPAIVEDIDTGAALDEALFHLSAARREASAELEFGELPSVRADARHVQLVFQNLIGNALKFRGEKPARVKIIAERDGALCRFSVVDEGVGVPTANRERLFSPFGRLHSREAFAGTGLGLASCRRIVERHGGAMWLDESHPHTCFSFTLPAASGGQGASSMKTVI